MTMMPRDRRRRWMDPFDRGFFDWPAWSSWPGRQFESLRRALDEDEVKVEEFTEDGELVVRAELPGVDPEQDVDVSIRDGNLCIRAERHHEEKTEGRDYRRTEIRYGAFSRILPLPAKAKEEDIKASYKDGILEVRAPIDKEKPEPSRIPVTRS